MRQEIKSMYDSWCQGKSQSEIELKYREFVIKAGKTFGMYELEMLEYLEDMGWFKTPTCDSRIQPD